MAKRPSKLSEGSESPQRATAAPVRRVSVRRLASMTQEQADHLVLQLTQAAWEEASARDHMERVGSVATAKIYRRRRRRREICEERVVKALMSEFVE